MAPQNWLARLLSRLRGPQDTNQSSGGLVLNEMPAVTYAVGDVHGCLSLYRRLEDKLVEDATRVIGSKLIVLLGDIIDRGPESAGMVDHLLKPSPAGFERLCLLGNHEEMMLYYFDEPAAHQAWLSYGGCETLKSYGIQPDPSHSWEIPARRMQLLMQSHIPEQHLRFLKSLPLYLSLPEYYLVHGGIDPRKPLENQSRQDLLWIRLEERLESVAVEKTVVHGHTPVSVAKQIGWRIPVDTGAFFSGVLSAVKLRTGQAPEFITVME